MHASKQGEKYLMMLLVILKLFYYCILDISTIEAKHKKLI